MNTLRALLSSLILRHARVLAANEEQPVAVANEGVVAGSFSIEQADGFTIQYGEYSHSAGVQLFDKASAEAMANELSSLLGKLTRGFRGVPVYAGHPDHHDLKIRTQFPDRKARGWIKEIIAGENEAKFIVAWNELGRSEVEDAQWAGYSPYWLMQPVAGLKARPVKLISFALTNNPNIPVTPLIVANEDGSAGTPARSDSATNNEPATKNQEQGTMNIDLNKLITALTEAGLIKEGDDESAILSSIGSLARELQWAREARERMELEKAEMKAELASEVTAENENDHAALLRLIVARVKTLAANETAARQQLTAANERADNERAARVDAELHRLVSAANITAAERDAQRPALIAAANEDEFKSLLSGLSQKKITLQTKPQIAGDLAGQRGLLAANEQERSNKRMALVQKHVKALCGDKSPTGEQYDAAWNKARHEAPDLF